jgi:hypothetical protein
MGLFKKGFEGAREAAAAQEEAVKNRGKKLFNFFLSDSKEEADIIFLIEEPYNCYMHNIQSSRNGKQYFEQVVCTEDAECVLCRQGDRPSYKGVFLIVDTRSFEVTVNGKKETRDGSLKLWLTGTRITSQLDRLFNKRGLKGRIYTVARTGSGTATTYMLDAGDPVQINNQEVLNMLPEPLKEIWGTGSDVEVDNFMQEQLRLRMKNNVESEPEYDTSYKKVVPVDDEEPDEATPQRKLRPEEDKITELKPKPRLFRKLEAY